MIGALGALGAVFASKDAPATEQNRCMNAYTIPNKQSKCLVRAIRRILGRSCVRNARVMSAGNLATTRAWPQAVGLPHFQYYPNGSEVHRRLAIAKSDCK